jgi:hypothetical protein
MLSTTKNNKKQKQEQKHKQNIRNNLIPLINIKVKKHCSVSRPSHFV